MSALRRWRVKQFENNRLDSMRAENSIALGFAWRAKNVGGVRRHLECIEQYSSQPIALYPSGFACDVISDSVERNSYATSFDAGLIDQHALFHSHVDPRFIGVSREAQKRGKPWVHTYHLLYFAEDWDHKLAPWQMRTNDCLIKVARQADVCLSVGTWLVDWLKTTHGIKSNYLPNGVDIVACDRAQPERFTTKFGVEDFVLFVNSIAQVKNPLDFIKVAEQIPHKTFVMIGTGLTKVTLEKTFGIEMPENIIPLGPLPHDQTLDAIAACSAFVMTSHREGLPTVLLEAMTMKKSCIVPDSPWFADAIEGDDHGLKYAPGNLEMLSEKIEVALNQGSLDSARKRVEQKFAWPVIMRQLDDLYSKLLS